MERSALPVSEEYKKATKFGVVIFVVDNEKRIYTQTEMEENPSTGKVSGRLSVICETRGDEETWDKNAIRGILEETGIEIGHLPLVLTFSDAKVWETRFIDGVWASVIVMHCKDPELFMKFVNESGYTDGVKPNGFMDATEFANSNLREGVRNIFNNFRDSILENEKINFN